MSGKTATAKKGRSQGALRTCPKGHRYMKGSDCPTCPKCEAAKDYGTGFVEGISAPARRALAGLGIDTPAKLAKHTEAEVMARHGMGPASLPKMRAALKKHGLSFRKT